MRLIAALLLIAATPALAQQGPIAGPTAPAATGPAAPIASGPAAPMAPGPALERARYDGCVRAIPTNATNALEFAQGWRIRNGGLPALHCAALAFLQLERFADAARTLEEAAQKAEAVKAPQAADFWGQAGNAWFLDGKRDKAGAAFDRAILLAGDYAPRRSASLHVDRARVAADGGDLGAARIDLDRAIALNPDDATALMLSAALARRQNDLPRATRDIAAASAKAPEDVDVMLEQAQIAAANGDTATARRILEMILKAAPGSAAADIAAKSLAANP